MIFWRIIMDTMMLKVVICQLPMITLPTDMKFSRDWGRDPFGQVLKVYDHKSKQYD